MHRELLLILSCLPLFFSSACISLNEYMAAESELEKCNTQLAQSDENLKNMEAE